VSQRAAVWQLIHAEKVLNQLGEQRRKRRTTIDQAFKKVKK
jgi:hypothetical protein